MIFQNLLILCVSPLSAFDIQPVISTTHGKIQGSTKQVFRTAATALNTEAFLGIPYALPPIGDLRFAAPVDAAAWEDTLIADNYGAGCPMVPDQLGLESDGRVFPAADMWNTKSRLDEDCLNLNIWRPSQRKEKEKLPIAVWLYGGAYFSGSNSLDVYDGRIISGVGKSIFISINYRLGPLGFLPPIPGSNAPGNVGLLDQRLALRWIAENAENLGGDRDRITLIGESAGATSVGFHLLNKWKGEPLVDRPNNNGDLSKPYFKNAIFQSGTPNAGWTFIYKEEAYKRTNLMAKQVKCPVLGDISNNNYSIDQQAHTFRNVLECLRKKSWQEIINIGQWVTPFYTWLFPFVPVVGGPMLEQLPEVLMRNFIADTREIQDPTNLISGWNSNEGSWLNIYYLDGLGYKTDGKITEQQFDDNLKLTFTPLSLVSKKLAKNKYVNWEKIYSGNFNTTNGHILYQSGELRDALNMLTGDYHLVCPALDWARDFSRNKNSKMFSYLLDYRLSNIAWPDWAGVLHGYEIELMFGVPLRSDKQKLYNKKDRQYSAIMLKYWLNFIHNGDVNVDFMSPRGDHAEYYKINGLEFLTYKLPKWPKIDNDNLSHLKIADMKVNEKSKKIYLATVNNPRADFCHFWKYTVPMVNQATQNVDQSYFDWMEDMRRWRCAMSEYEQAKDTSNTCKCDP